MFKSIHTMKNNFFQCLFSLPGRKTQTSDYHINKLWHFVARHVQDTFFLRYLDQSLDFYCNLKNLKELIMSPKSHATDTRTFLNSKFGFAVS